MNSTDMREIGVMIVIDTEWVKENYPNPSTNKLKPTGIAHDGQFMICTDSREKPENQGTADLEFTAHPGDYVAFRGISASGNSDDAVIVYGIRYWKGDHVFNGFSTNLVERQQAAVPDINKQDGLPALKQKMSFISYDSKVAKSGTENFYVDFALYTLKDGEIQDLYGYFTWDPSIKVK